MFKKGWVLPLLFMMFVMIAVACSSNEGDNNQETTAEEQVQPENTAKENEPAGTKAAESAEPKETQVPEMTSEPIELYIRGAGEAVFEQFWADPIKKKYPNVTMKLRSESVADILAANMPIDIMISAISVINTYIDPGLTMDLSDLIKKYNFDLSRFQKGTMEPLTFSTGGEVIGFPLKNINNALFYNKALFDQFGVDYPTDGMTWDEVLKLAETMTRKENGVQYRGFTTDWAQLIQLNQWSMNIVDPTTNKVTFNTEPRWKEYVETFLPFFTMAGYDADAKLMGNGPQTNLFMKEQTAAMLYTNNSRFPKEADSETLNWDMVSSPEFPDLPGVGSQSLPAYLLVSSTSKYPDEAFLVIQQYVSDEVQTFLAKENLSTTALANQQVRDALGEGQAWLDGKNLSAFFPENIAEATTVTTYNSQARNILRDQIFGVIAGEKDVNTVLREAEEKANMKIAEMMGAAGN